MDSVTIIVNHNRPFRELLKSKHFGDYWRDHLKERSEQCNAAVNVYDAVEQQFVMGYVPHA